MIDYSIRAVELLHNCVCAGGSGRPVFRRLWDLTMSCCMQHHMVFCISPYLSDETSSGSAQVSSSRNTGNKHQLGRESTHSMIL